jgi:hypothetical protein
MSTVLRPESGVLSASKPVQLECVIDARHSDSFAPHSFNNTDYQDGSGKWSASAALVTNALPYRRNGVAWSLAHGGGVASSTMSLTTNHVDTYLNMNNDCIIKNTITTKCTNVSGINIRLELIVWDTTMPLRRLRYMVDISYATGIHTWRLYFIDEFGVTIFSSSGNISGAMLEKISLTDWIYELAIAWSKRAQDATNNGLTLYVNGYHLTTFDSVLLSLEDIGPSAATTLTVSYNGSPGALPKTFNGTMRNFMVMPYILYGNGTTHDYANAISDESNIKVLEHSLLNQSFVGWPVTASLLATYFMGFRLRTFERSGLQPLSAVMPVTNAVEPIVFEYTLYNKSHNNPFVPKAPHIMIDESLKISDDYIYDGAVYDADNDEHGIVPIYDIGRTPTNHKLPSQNIQIGNLSEWPGMLNGSGDGDKVNNEVSYKLKPTKKRSENSSKMLNEESYTGFVIHNDGMGDANGGGAGNGGWPLCCDRSPSSPMEFIRDNGNYSSIVMSNNLRYHRFVELPHNTADRYKSLFVAWCESAAPSGTPTAWNMDLVVGRILNNDRTDSSAPFTVTGYYVLDAGLSINVIYDLPQALGITTPSFRLLPDLSLIHIGDPSTSTTHRIYRLAQNTIGGDYSFDIKYYTLSDCGETLVDSGLVVFEDYLFVGGVGGGYVKSILQFDIIQPRDGFFIMVAVMGSRDWDQGQTIEGGLAMMSFSSEDGIHFRNPSLTNLDGLEFKYKPVGDLYTYAFPALSYSNYGPYAGEILLGVTQINGEDEENKYKSGIFRTFYDGRTWSSTSVNSWTMIVACNELVQEVNYDNYKSLVLGTAAFRDHVGKLHVAINKIPYVYYDEQEPFIDDPYGAMYYVVLDYNNSAEQYNVVNNNASGIALGQYDIVSFNRFAQHNRPIDLDITYAYCCLLRPHFSPCNTDCYFTFNPQYLDGYIDTYTHKASDLVYRLFKPTDLGELYPPGPMWHYAMGKPAEDASVDPWMIWRQEDPLSIFPDLTQHGLEWYGFTQRNASYNWYQEQSITDYDARHPNNTFACKARFKLYTKDSIGTPIDYANDLIFSVVIKSWLWGLVPNAVANDYLYSTEIYFFFNYDSVEIYAGAVPTLVWSRSTIDVAFFSNFRDVYIIGRQGVGTNSSFWNIYAERNTERWEPKSFMLLNEEPIEISSNIISVGVYTNNEINFGGCLNGSSDPCGDDSLWLKYFQVYHPMFKAPGNMVLRDGAGNKIDPHTTGYDCVVGGPTESLSTRPYAFDNWKRTNDSSAVFQSSCVSRNNQRGINYYSSFNTIGSTIPSVIDIGNNTAITINNPVNIESVFNEEILFKYVYARGIKNALDKRPSTYWGCSSESSITRVAFSSRNFVVPLDSLAANSIWFLNTNLINVRIKASTLPNAWGVAPFEEYISFIVDNGVVCSVYGAGNLLMIEDTTKNWTPGQFVNVDFPYHIINSDASISFTGGAIVKNTKTQIWYRTSTRLNGTLYSSLPLGSNFSIVAPSRFYKFSGGVKDYPYWALEIIPGEVGDYEYFCNGLGRIGELDVGLSIDLGEYGNPGFAVSLTNNANSKLIEAGSNSILVNVGKNNMQYELSLDNVSLSMAHKLLDILRVCEERGIPLWFIPTTINNNELYLCDFVDGKLSIDTTMDNYLDIYGNGDEHEGRVRVSAMLRQRI